MMTSSLVHITLNLEPNLVYNVKLAALNSRTSTSALIEKEFEIFIKNPKQLENKEFLKTCSCTVYLPPTLFNNIKATAAEQEIGRGNFICFILSEKYSEVNR